MLEGLSKPETFPMLRSRDMANAPSFSSIKNTPFNQPEKNLVSIFKSKSILNINFIVNDATLFQLEDQS
jgi:hypothetical protein